MKPAIYVGPLTHLRGKGALLRDTSSPDRILAQFDDTTLTLSGAPIPQMTVLEYEPHARFPVEVPADLPMPTTDCLGFNWHLFPRSDFEVAE